MRAIFFVLVVANLLLFAYGQGWFGQAGGGEPERLTSQLQPEKIRIVSKGEPAAAPESPSEVCRSFAAMPRDAAQRLASLVHERDALLKAEQRNVDEPATWWVYIPPLANRQTAEKKADELKKLGLKEFRVLLEEGENQHAISLGLFRNEQGAKTFLDTVQKKGVRSARLQAREASEKATLEVRGPGERVEKALQTLPSEFATLTVSECGK